MNTKPRTEIVLITPEIATEWLENNHNNRPISDRTVARYAEDMRAGKWTLNGESIKFDVNGKLIDGQNRLFAAFEHKVSFRTLVTRDLPEEAFATIDTGRKRTASDAMHFAGLNVSNKTHIAAAVRLINGYRTGKLAVKNSGMTNADILMFLRDEPGIIAMVSKVKHAMGKALGGMVSPISAVLYLASRRLNVEEFLEKVGSGEGLAKNSPMLTLRNKLLTSVNRKDATERFWSIVIAWNAYVSGRQLQVIRVPQDPPSIEGAG